MEIKKNGIEAVCCYSHKDQELLIQLETHLSLLQRQERLTLWTDIKIDPGTEWDQEIRHHLDTAQMILLFISSDFIKSDYCWGVEMQRALERHNRREVVVIPIIARPVDWQDAPFSKIQVLPKGTLPITDWPNPDNAFRDIVKGIRGVLDKMGVEGREISGGTRPLISPTIPPWSPRKGTSRVTPAGPLPASPFSQPGQILLPPHVYPPTETITPAWSSPLEPATDLINTHRAPTGNIHAFPSPAQHPPAITQIMQPTPDATGPQKQPVVPPPLHAKPVNPTPPITTISDRSSLLDQIARFVSEKRLVAWIGFTVLSLTLGCLFPWLTYAHNANTYEAVYNWPLFVIWGLGEIYDPAKTVATNVPAPYAAIIGAIAVAGIGLLFLRSKKRWPFLDIFGGITLNIIAFTYFTFNWYINSSLIYTNFSRFYFFHGPFYCFTNEFIFLTLFTLWSFVGTRCFLRSANTPGRLLFGTLLTVICLVNIIIIVIYTHYFITISGPDTQFQQLNVFLWIAFLPLGVDSLRALICGVVAMYAAFHNRKSKIGPEG